MPTAAEFLKQGSGRQGISATDFLKGVEEPIKYTPKPIKFLKFDMPAKYGVDTSDIDPIPEADAVGFEALTAGAASMLVFPVSGLAGLTELLVLGETEDLPGLPDVEGEILTNQSLRRAGEIAERIASSPSSLISAEEQSFLHELFTPVEWINTAGEFYGDFAAEKVGPHAGAAVKTTFEILAYFGLPRLAGRFKARLQKAKADKIFLENKQIRIEAAEAAKEAGKIGMPLLEPDKTPVKSTVPQHFPAQRGKPVQTVETTTKVKRTSESKPEVGMPLIKPDKTPVKSTIPKHLQKQAVRILRPDEIVEMRRLQDLIKKGIATKRERAKFNDFLHETEQATLARPLKSEKIGMPLLRAEEPSARGRLPQLPKIEAEPRAEPPFGLKRGEPGKVKGEAKTSGLSAEEFLLETQEKTAPTEKTKAFEPKTLTEQEKIARKVVQELEAKRKYRGGTTLSFMGVQEVYNGIVNMGKRAFKKASQHGADAMTYLQDRSFGVNRGIFDSEVFIRSLESKHSVAEMEALPFILDKPKDVKATMSRLGREDLITIIENPPKELKQTAGKIQKYYVEGHKFLASEFSDVGYMHNYVTQMWDMKRSKGKPNRFVLENPFTQERTIPSWEEGIKYGFTPRTLHMGEILRVYDQYKIRTVANRRLARSLKNMVDEEGTPLIQPFDKAPEHWVEFNHPALNEPRIKKKTQKIKRSKGRGGLARESYVETLHEKQQTVKVHPDIAKEVAVVFTEPWSGGWINAYETINAFTKKSMLSLSLFHHLALTEAAFSTGVGVKAVKLWPWNPKKLYQALKNKKYPVFEKIEVARDGLDHGLILGDIADVQRGRVQRALKEFETMTKETPALRHVSKNLRKANDLWDAALWDYYHNTLKLMGYEKNVFHALKQGEKIASKKHNRSLSPQEIKEIKISMAKFTNDTFGGQNWDISRVFGNPRMRQSLQWAFLAPDWTISTLKQAAAPARGAYQWATAKKAPTVAGEATRALKGKVLFKRGSAFWIRAGVYFNAIAQSINYAVSQKMYGKGRFTWDNAPNHELDVLIGRNADGTERYMRLGKQFREALEWAVEPEKRFGAKLSPVAREAIRQVAAHDPGSGFPTPWSDEPNVWRSLKERGLSAVEMPVPFSLRPYIEDRPTMFMFSIPTSKGMTRYQAVKLFKEAIKSKDVGRIKHIYFSALENNLNAEQHFKTASAAVKANVTYDDRKIADEILRELMMLDPQARIDAYKTYVKRGIITDNVENQMNKILEEDAKVRELKEQHGIR